MARLVSFAGRTAYVLAWLVVLGAATLIVLEGSGVLASSLRTMVAWRLGPLGDGLEIGSVRLLWFEPGVEIRDVRIRRLTNGRTESPHVTVRSIHVSASWNELPEPKLAVHVAGGRVRLSDEFFRGVTTLLDSLPESSGESTMVPVIVRDFEVALEDVTGETLELGSVDLVIDPAPDGATLVGEFESDLLGATASRALLHVSGRQIGSSIELTATADGVRLETEEFTMPASVPQLPIEEFAGNLSLAATASIDLDAKTTRGGLRASISKGRLLPRAGGPWIDDIEIDVRTAFDAEDRTDLWDKRSWDTVARARAKWAGEPVEAWGKLGRAVSEGAWARCFARLPRLHLGEALLDAVGLPPDDRDVREVWRALSPSGVADANVDLVLERKLGEEVEFTARAAGHLRARGETGMMYRGFPSTSPGSQPGDHDGFDIPVTGMRGDVVFTFDLERDPMWQLASPGIVATVPGGDADGWAYLSARERGNTRIGTYMDIEFGTDGVRLDDTWHAALAASPLTRDIMHDYGPRGGRAATRWWLHDAPDTRGLTAHANIDVEGTDVTWRDLPIPVRGASGNVRILWALAESTYVEGTPRRKQSTGYRPLGVSFELANDPKPGQGVRASVKGFAREESLPAEIAVSDVERDWTFAIDVGIDEMLVSGDDAQVLASVVEAYGEWRGELSPRGRLDVAWRSGSELPGAPYAAYIEAEPTVLELTPNAFPMRTTDVRGRLLGKWTTPVTAAPEPDAAASDTFQLDGLLVARWPSADGGVELGAALRVPNEGEGTLDVLGAGIDVEDGAFRGTVIERFGIDLSDSSVVGRNDGAIRILFETGADAPDEQEPSVGMRFFLREATLANGSVRLDGLRGVLAGSTDALRSERLDASLSGHPIVLRDVLWFPLERAHEVEGVDRSLLVRRVTASEGQAIQATISTDRFPLDEPHLESLVDEKTLDALRENKSFSGYLDLEEAKVLITVDDEQAGKVVLSGPVRPRDVSLRFGIPIDIASGDVNVREAVLEQGSLRGWAEIENMIATIAERELEDGRMILGVFDQRLTIDDLEGTFEGGTIRSLGASGYGARRALGLDLTSSPRFDLALQLEGVEVDGLMRGVFQSSIADTGILNATLELSGTSRDVLGLSGRGSVDLREGRLWSIPVVRALLGRLGFPNTAVFNRFSSRFELRDGVLDTHSLELKSTLLKLVGEGTIDLEGDLSFDLDVRYSLLDRLGIFNRLIYWLNRSLMRVAIRGDFYHPDVAIRSSLFELFGGGPSSPKRRLPVPEFEPLAPRF